MAHSGETLSKRTTRAVRRSFPHARQPASSPVPSRTAHTEGAERSGSVHGQGVRPDCKQRFSVFFGACCRYPICPLSAPQARKILADCASLHALSRSGPLQAPYTARRRREILCRSHSSNTILRARATAALAPGFHTANTLEPIRGQNWGRLLATAAVLLMCGGAR